MYVVEIIVILNSSFDEIISISRGNNDVKKLKKNITKLNSKVTIDV